jgi:cytochrome b6-f complex subunit 4
MGVNEADMPRVPISVPVTIPAEFPERVAERPAEKAGRTSGWSPEWTTVTLKELDHEAEWGHDAETMRFFPDHFLSEATAMVLLLCLYAVLCIFMPAGLEIKANPLITPAGIKPEWYFLFLYAFLHYVPVVVGVMGSLFGVVFLMAIPWIDRNPSRKPSRRLVAIALSIILLAGVVGLTIVGIMD